MDSPGGSAGGWSATCDHSTPLESVAGGPVSIDLIDGNYCTQERAEPLLSAAAGRLEWIDEYTANVYVGAGEAIVFRSGVNAALVDGAEGWDPRLMVDLEPRPRPDRTSTPRQLSGQRSGPAGVPVGSAGGRSPGDAERSVRGRRAKLRRLCTHHNTAYLSTLTYRGTGEFSWTENARNVWNFRRQLRALFPGLRGPVVTVPEWHPGGHGLHVHVATSELVPKAMLERCWSHGFVDDGERSRRRRTAPVSPKRVGRYVAKYLGKAHEGAERPLGGHTYDVSQGFGRISVRVTGLGRTAVEAAAAALLFEPVTYAYDFGTDPAWRGPPGSFLAT